MGQCNGGGKLAIVEISMIAVWAIVCLDSRLLLDASLYLYFSNYYRKKSSESNCGFDVIRFGLLAIITLHNVKKFLLLLFRKKTRPIRPTMRPHDDNMIV